MTVYDFYLLDESFVGSEKEEIPTLKKKLEQLASDCEYIRENNERIYKNDSIYNVEIISGHQLYEFLWNSNCTIVDYDTRIALMLIIDKALTVTTSSHELISQLDNHNQNSVTGIIGLNEIQGINSRYLIYNKNDYFNFHRYFLKLYPGSIEEYLFQCKIYFPNLHIHDRNLHTLQTTDGGFLNFKNHFCNCLEYLNNMSITERKTDNILEFLRKIQGESGYETTMEGDAEKKEKMTFDFTDNNQKSTPVCCEPHMKLSRSDNPGDSKHYTNRIYFHIGTKDILNGKILIGHMGSHINFDK